VTHWIAQVDAHTADVKKAYEQGFKDALVRFNIRHNEFTQMDTMHAAYDEWASQ